MKKVAKLLTFVLFLFISAQTVQAESKQFKKDTFTQIQNELWIHGIVEISPEMDNEIQDRINDISNLSATEFYPEELTQALNKI